MSAGRVLRLLAGALALSSAGAVALGAPLVDAPGRAQARGTNLGSFAWYLLFTQIHTAPDGSAIWFTSDAHFDGPVHTNGEFRFAYQPYFGDRVSSVSGQAWFHNDGVPVELEADHNGSIDVPQFIAGFDRNAPSIALPPDAYPQQNATLGLDPSSITPPTTLQIRVMLGLTSGSGVPTDVYLPNTGPTGTPPNTLTGGIYVQGDLSQCLMKVDASGKQVYVLRQGSSTDTIRVNLSTGTTTFYNAGRGTTTTYSGQPKGLLFANGSIGDLRGPDRVGGVPPPALANDTQLLIIAAGDIVIQRDVTCQNYATGNNVLGLFSSGGSVRIGTSAPNDMDLDAFVMATGPSGAFEVDNYDSGSPRGTFRLRGGSASTYYGAFNTHDASGVLQTGYARDFHLDRRRVIPPYYPTVPVFATAIPPSPVPTAALCLSIPRPNPSRGAMSVSYTLPRAGAVRLTLFDVLGRCVARLVDGEQPAGEHVATWDGGRGTGRKVAPGIYLLELDAAGERTHVRVVMLE